MTGPPFVMSKYLDKESLYKDKSDYYQRRCHRAEKLLEELMCKCIEEISDADDVEEIKKAMDHIDMAFQENQKAVSFA